MFDVVIVGAGFAGSVLARQFASRKNKKVLLVEKRRHIAGNCYDWINRNGVLVHKYGPHLFHTSNKEIYSYLEQFTQWQEYQHHVLAAIDGKMIPLPFNLNSLEMLFPCNMASSLESKLIDNFGFGVKVPILELKKVNDPELKELADFIYTKIFVNYTAKQWGCAPEDISAEVTGRVPVHISRDNRYFQDVYQAVPKDGYTSMFENILNHPGIHLLLNTDYKDVVDFDPASGRISLFGVPFSGEFIFTGMIDELFGYCFGRLPYRSLDFKFETLEREYYQDAAVVNYPNNFNFTRITEFKHIHPRKLQYTTILREFPRDYKGTKGEEDTPSYPVFTDQNTRCYQQYQDFASQYSNITLIGRLAEYRYYDMDDIVARALELFSSKFS
jgi:UDP-galactopyranose mutase